MEPTASRKPPTGQTEFVFGEESVNATALPLSPAASDAAKTPQDPKASQCRKKASPGCLGRLAHALYAVFCAWLGWMLILLPWRPGWETNALVADHPFWQALLQDYFVRGLVSGLGIVDLWLGVAGVVRGRAPRTDRNRSRTAGT